MSRLQQAKKAVRPALPARALLAGPPGAGKTRSALIVAEVLAEGGQVLVIDTEKESALTYADDFTFDHLPWAAPFEPRELGKTIIDAGTTYAVVVVDSMSHFWRGDGGVLDIADGKFTGWKDARPAQADLVDSILACRAHFLGCTRSKVDHVQEPNGKGGFTVKKLGMAVVQDAELEYEMNVALELDMDHSMTVSKSRTIAVPVGRAFKAGHAEDFAVLYRDWLKGGEPPAAAKDVAELVDRMGAMPAGKRKACKAEFFAAFGRPDHLRESQLTDARVMVASFEAMDGDFGDVESGGGGESGESPRVDEDPPVTVAPSIPSGGDADAPVPVDSPPDAAPDGGGCDLEDLAALMVSTGWNKSRVLNMARQLSVPGVERPAKFADIQPGPLLDQLVEELGKQPDKDDDPPPDGGGSKGSHPDGGGVADTASAKGTDPTNGTAGNGAGHEPGTSAPSEQVGAEATGATKAPPNQRRWFAIAGAAASAAGCTPDELRARVTSIVTRGASESASGFGDATWCDMADMAQTLIDDPKVELWQRANGEWTVSYRPGAGGRRVPRDRPGRAA